MVLLAFLLVSCREKAQPLPVPDEVGATTTPAPATSEAGPPPDGVVDVDGDGFRSPVDCNDNEARMNPGNREICNDGVDNDCKDGDLRVCP